MNKKMNKKQKNKGFSLVELIVVIAIMAILAVTLAPRLTQYIERSRRGSDQEVVNTIYAAAKLANAEYPITTSAVALESTIYDVNTGATVPKTDWTFKATTTDIGNSNFTTALKAILSEFKLKSTYVTASTTISLAITSTGKVTVILDYNGTTTDLSEAPAIVVTE